MGSSVVDIAYQTARQMGLTHEAAAGVLGNIAVESSFNPLATNGTHTGLFQWDNDDRLPRLIAKGMDINDPVSQVQHAINELGPDFIKALNGSKTPTEAATIWENQFERSGGQMMEERLKNAEEFAKKYSGLTYDQANFNISNPNEPLDTDALIRIGTEMIGNGGDKLANASKIEAMRQAYHQSFSPYQADAFAPTDKQLMNIALEKAKAEEQDLRQGKTLTAAGKLAKMIANSSNANNISQIAAFAKNLGIQLADRNPNLADGNAVAMQKIQRQQQIEDREWQYQKQRELAAMNAQAQMARRAMRTQGGGNTPEMKKEGSIAEREKLRNVVKAFRDEYRSAMDSIDAGKLGDPSVWKPEFERTGTLPILEEIKNRAIEELEPYSNLRGYDEALFKLTENDPAYITNYVAKTYPKDGSYYNAN